MSNLLAHTHPHTNFAKRVEKIVCEVCQIRVDQLWAQRRLHKYSQPRHLVFSILWQPNGFRSLQWLAARYGLSSHKSVLFGIDHVEKSLTLKQKQLTIIELLVIQLEIELFGSRSPCYDTTSEPR